MRFVVFRDDDAAARFLVETMHDTGALFSANAGRIRAMMQERVDEGVLALACARMKNEPRGFIDDDQVGVLEQNVEWDRLGLVVDSGWRRLRQIDLIAGPDEIARPRGRAV